MLLRDMKTVRLRGYLAILLLAGGCGVTTPRWTRPNTTVEQYDADRSACLAASRRYLPTSEAWTDYDVLARCMLMKGYTAPPRP